MIQIQDDVSMNQGVPTPITAPSPMVAQSSTTNSAPSASAMSQQDTSKTDQTAEIDRLLAELDKLSKELEEEKKPAAAPAVSESVMPATVAPAPVTPVATAAPAPTPVSSSVQDQVVTQQPESTTMPMQESASKQEEKFDFDAFLADLEKKIDEEAAKNKSAEQVSAPADQVELANDSSDFRQNRQPAPLVKEDDGGSDDVAVVKDAATVNNVAETNDVAATKDESEDLKSQNIFDMLGLATISDEEKNQFLDELEMMIWDDFIVHDLELLLTSEEYTQARQILDDQAKSEDERKEALVVFLEKLIPDLDEVLYEKALELKSEMMAERLAKMKEGASEEVLAKVKQAEEMISQNRWRSAVALLSSS